MTKCSNPPCKVLDPTPTNTVKKKKKKKKKRSYRKFLKKVLSRKHRKVEFTLPAAVHFKKVDKI
jgi:hypothetical protein